MSNTRLPTRVTTQTTFRAWSVRFAALALALAAGCSAGESPDPADEDQATPVPLVETLAARRGALPLEQRVSGIVKAENQVMIRPEIEAPIVEVYVRTGEAVKRGQPLVRLLDDTAREQLRQAEAAVRFAEATAVGTQARVSQLEAQVVRTRALAGQQLVSDQQVEVEEAELAAEQAAGAEDAARVEQARATVEERRSTIDKTILRAPIAGHVGRREAEVGMLAQPGTPLFVLGNLDELIVEVPLTERMLADLDEGTPVLVSSPALGDEAIPAKLSRISPFLAQGSFSTLGEIDLDNAGGRLRPGMFVTVDIIYGQSEQATLVPTTALWEDPQADRRGLFIVDLPRDRAPHLSDPATSEQSPTPRSVVFREVQVVAEGRGVAGVRGVEEGEWVVAVGQHLLSIGDPSTARVRLTSWDRVLELQGLQREDLLRDFLAEQQRWAKERGSRPPSNEEFVRGGSGAAAAR